MNSAQVTEGFRDTIGEYFDSFLASYGFQKTKSVAEEIGFTVVYRNGERYVRIGGTLHPHDYPYYFNVVFGVGSDQMPESDWNATALWRLVKATKVEYYNQYATLSTIPDGISAEQIDEKVRIKKMLCEQYGGEFLNNDLTLFSTVRADQNKFRVPYKVYKPSANGELPMHFDAESSALKEKFST